MADSRRGKGVSLAKGPVGLIGLLALIYGITAALWNPSTRRLLDSGHAKGRVIKLETATQGLGIPLHAGAEKFYKEKGLIK